MIFESGLKFKCHKSVDTCIQTKENSVDHKIATPPYFTSRRSPKSAILIPREYRVFRIAYILFYPFFF